MGGSTLLSGTFSVNVTGTTAGLKSNTSRAVTSSNGGKTAGKKLVAGLKTSVVSLKIVATDHRGPRETTTANLTLRR